MDDEKVVALTASPSLEFAIDLQQAVQIYIRRPSPYMNKNLVRVLPEWKLPTAWVVIVLQRSRVDLTENSPPVAQEKDRLREQFISFGFKGVLKLRDRGFKAELFDPKSGYPLLSSRGDKSHDDVAAVSTLLGFPITVGNCSYITHPQWGTAVYPGILMASGTPDAIATALRQVALCQGWQARQKALPADFPQG